MSWVGDEWGLHCCSQLITALFSEICSVRGPRILKSTRFSAFELTWMFFPGSVWKKNFSKYCFLFWESFPGSPAPPLQCSRLLMFAPTFLYYAWPHTWLSLWWATLSLIFPYKMTLRPLTSVIPSHSPVFLLSSTNCFKLSFPKLLYLMPSHNNLSPSLTK